MVECHALCVSLLVRVRSFCDQTIVVCEHDNHSVAVLSWADGSLSHRFGGNGNGPTQLYFPQGLRLLSNGTAFIVADCYNDRIVVASLAGEHIQTFKGGFDRPYDVVECDNGDGYLAVQCWSQQLVRLAKSSTAAVASIGSSGAEPGHFEYPVALALVPPQKPGSGCGVLVLEQKNARIQVFNCDRGETHNNC